MRVNYLDYAKALGIALVIVEHVIASYGFMQPVTVGILAFHMPLFFVIAGVQYSLKEKVGGITAKFVGKRAKRLLIPYAVFVSCILVYKITFTLLNAHTLTQDFLTYMSENIFVTGYGVGWFLIALFYAELLFKVAFITENKAFHAAAALLSCIIGIAFSFSGNVFLKLIARVEVACTFLWVGYYAGKCKKSIDKIPSLGFIGIFLLSVVLSEFNGQCSMLNVSFGVSRLLFLYNAAAMSLSFIGFVQHLETKEYPFLKSIGVHTLIILLTHTYVIFVVRYSSYLFLPHGPVGDGVSIVLQLTVTFAVEVFLVWAIITGDRKRKRKQNRKEAA